VGDSVTLAEKAQTLLTGHAYRNAGERMLLERTIRAFEINPAHVPLHNTVALIEACEGRLARKPRPPQTGAE